MGYNNELENDFIDVIKESELKANGNFKKPTITQVCGLYSLAVIMLIYIGFKVQRIWAYPGLLVTELVLILLPSLILLYRYKYNFKKVLRLNKVSLLNITIVVCVMMFSVPVVGALNAVNLLVIRKIFGKVVTSEAPLAGGPFGLLISLLIIACLPGLCEEIMFRGVLLRGFERLGMVKAILITSFLFGLIHLDFQRFLGTFLLGALIGFVVYRTNSIFAGMIAHFTNNAIAVLLTYGLSKFMNAVNNTGAVGKSDINDYFQNISNMSAVQLMAVVIFYGVILLVFSAALITLLYALIKNTSKEVDKVSKDSYSDKTGFIMLIPGIAFIGAMYLLEGLSLKGIKGALQEGIAWFLSVKG